MISLPSDDQVISNNALIASSVFDVNDDFR